MAILDPLYGTPLAVQLIPQVDRNFAEHLKLRDDQRSIGLLACSQCCSGSGRLKLLVPSPSYSAVPVID